MSCRINDHLSFPYFIIFSRSFISNYKCCFLYLFLSYFSFVCILLFVAVVVVLIVMFLPTYYYFTGCMQVAGEGTSPFCNSCTPLHFNFF